MIDTLSTIQIAIAFYNVWVISTAGAFLLTWRGQITARPLLETLVFGSIMLTLLVAAIVLYAATGAA